MAKADKTPQSGQKDANVTTSLLKAEIPDVYRRAVRLRAMARGVTLGKLFSELIRENFAKEIKEVESADADAAK
jgi:hypothetical protein